VIAERPLAAVQIVLAIFAVEALGQFNQVCTGYEREVLTREENLKGDDKERERGT
jgi:hypothetical protein